MTEKSDACKRGELVVQSAGRDMRIALMLFIGLSVVVACLPVSVDPNAIHLDVGSALGGAIVIVICGIMGFVALILCFIFEYEYGGHKKQNP